MTKGIILLAMGNRIYGNMAFNLALSIKATNRTIPIILYTDHNATGNLTDKHKAFFTEIRTLAPEYYIYDNKVMYFRAKSRLYDLSPFDHTLWLDADTVFIQGKDVADFFDIDADFLAQTYNLIDLDTGNKTIDTAFHNMIWGDPKQIKRYYKLPDKTLLPQINSSIIAFKKGDVAATMFDTVKELYKNPHPPCEGFRGEFPDEFFFHVAGAMTGIMSPVIPFTPLYGDHEFGHLYWQAKDIADNHYGVMTYGLDTVKHIQAYYNSIVDNAAKAVRFKQGGFRHMNKRKAGIRT